MLLNDTGRNAALTGGIGNLITFVGASTLVSTQTLPDDTGAQEVSGGSYARQGVAWGTAAAGLRTNSGSLSIPIPAGTTVAAITYHTAVTAGTYIGNAPLNTVRYKFGSVIAADVTANTVTSNAHGFTNTNRVFTGNLSGLAIPTALAENVLYFVVGATADTFQLANTSGGAAIDITGAGPVFVQDLVPEVFASAGSLAIAVGALTLDASVL